MIRSFVAPVLLLTVACGPPPVHTTPQNMQRPEPVAAPNMLVASDVPPPMRQWDANAPAAAPELVFQSAHRRGLSDLAFTPDSRQITLVSADGVASVVDARTGEMRASRRVFIRTGHRLVLPDRSGRSVVVASSSGFDGSGGVLRWDLHQNSWQWLLGPGLMFDATRFAVHPDDTTLAYLGMSGDQDAFEVVLRTPDGVVHSTGVGSEGNETFEFAPSGATLTVHSRTAGQIWLLDAASGEIKLTLTAEEGRRWLAPNYRPGGGALLTTMDDGHIMVRDPRDGSVRQMLRFDADVEDDAVVEVGWSGDGSLIVGRSRAGRVRSFDAQTGERVAAFEVRDANHYALDPSRARAFVVERDGVRSVDLRTGETGELIATAESVSALAISPDGTLIALAEGPDLEVLDAATGERRFLLPGGSGEHSVWGVTWSPDGQTLATWGRAGIETWGAAGTFSSSCSGTGNPLFPEGGTPLYQQGNRVCDVRSGDVLARFNGLIAVNPSGNVAITRDNAVVRVQNASSARPGPTLRLGGTPSCEYGPCGQASVAADGSIVALAVGDAVLVFDARGRRKARLRSAGASAARYVQVAPDGGSVFVSWRRADDGQRDLAELYAVRGGRSRARIELPGHVLQATYHPDGALLAFATSESVTILDVATGAQKASTPSPEGILPLRFAGDALIIDSNELVRVIDAEGNERLRQDVPRMHAVSDTGDAIATCVASEDGGGDVTVRDALTGRVQRLGPCFDTDRLAFAPGGAHLAHHSGPIVRVMHIPSGRAITLRTYRFYDEGVGMVGIPAAYDDRGGFEVDAAHLQRFRTRASGPLSSAALAAPDPAAVQSDLVSSFFALAGAGAPPTSPD